MPLSKAKNRERMRQIRLHERLSSPCQSKPVQPNLPFSGVAIRAIDEMYGNTSSERSDSYSTGIIGWDADGNPVHIDN